MKIMTLNIRRDDEDDRLAHNGRNSWANRKSLVLSLIRDESPDCLSIQEAYYHQYDYLRNELQDHYYSCFVGRGDGQKEGEGAVIFVKNTNLTLKEQGVFWLSDTPNSPGSKCPDTMFPRICAYVKLEDKKKKKFIFASTHYSHVSSEARCQASDLILEQYKKLFGKSVPFIIAGDFNAESNSAEIKKLETELSMGGGNTSAESQKRTTNEFDRQEDDIHTRIDYIFYSSDFHENNYKVCPEKKDARFFSDHAAVTLNVILTDPT